MTRYVTWTQGCAIVIIHVMFYTIMFMAFLLASPSSAFATTSAGDCKIGIDQNTHIQTGYGRELELLAKGAGAPLSAKELSKFKGLLCEYGWPTTRSVGVRATNDAAKLVLYAKSDYAFQSYLENLVHKLVGISVNGIAFAHWDDLIEQGHDNEQQFGTLLTIKNGMVSTKPHIKVSAANSVRFFVGLPPLKNVIRLVQSRVDRGETLTEAERVPEFAMNYRPFSNPDLRNEIGTMVRADQLSRLREMKAGFRPDKAGEGVEAVDAHNLDKLKTIFRKYGVPTPRMVGFSGVSSFVLLVVHAVKDPTLQSNVIQQLRARIQSGTTPLNLYATLVDKVDVTADKKQLYGTQAHDVDGKMRPFPIENVQSLNRRRASMGLVPENSYLKALDHLYARRKK